jgi:putative GTP pyrophosphokinase
VETPDQSSFLTRYHHPPTVLSDFGISWDALVAIYAHHTSRSAGLVPSAQFVVAQMQGVPQVHSLRFRVKDAEHLIDKVIRKKRDNPDLEISVENYQQHIHDLVGVRALHLFKADWAPIHDFISGKWDLLETPQANIREGDPAQITKQFEDKKCIVKEHPLGYRSVHYLLRVRATRDEHVVEVQTRTIFEEGWSEIDHRFHYPYAVHSPILGEFLAIFNRLAGSADEMGSYVAALKRELDVRETKYRQAVDQLSRAIAKSNLDAKEKKELEDRVQELEATKQEYSSPFLGAQMGAGYIVNLRTPTSGYNFLELGNKSAITPAITPWSMPQPPAKGKKKK